MCQLLLPHFYHLSGLDKSRYDEVLKIVNAIEMDFSAFLRVDKKRRKFFDLTLHGTVASGHPTRTTLGNSLRVILYNKFMLHYAKIDKFSLSVGGDDTFLLIEKEQRYAFEKVFW